MKPWIVVAVAVAAFAAGVGAGGLLFRSSEASPPAPPREYPPLSEPDRVALSALVLRERPTAERAVQVKDFVARVERGVYTPPWPGFSEDVAVAFENDNRLFLLLLAAEDLQQAYRYRPKR